VVAEKQTLLYTPSTGARALYSFIYRTMAKTFSFTPLGDRIVVKPAEKEGEKKLASGIIIPDSVDKEKPAQGTVVAVGEGKYDDGARIPLQVKVGDLVLFSRYGYDEVKIEGQEYYILAESNVLGIVK
jgi:chaperonin GroES